MGKKKDDRVVIDGTVSSSKNKKIGMKEPNPDECLILSTLKRKITADFQQGNRFSINGERRYITLNYDHEKTTPAFLYENQKRELLKYQLEYENKLKHARQPI